MNLRILWVLAAAAVLHPSTSAAQYSRSAGDTLRYQEVTEGRARVQQPGGTLDIRTLHDGVLALAFSGGDEAVAWYERLHLEQHGPQGQRQKPSTRSVIDQPFHLTFAATGRISTIGTPSFPAPIASMTDLTQQFRDFFITIPEGDLPVGREWADTLLHTTAGRPRNTFRAHGIRSYRVEATTEVRGDAAVVIRVSQRMELEGTSPLDQPGMRAASRLTGVEEGQAIFSPSTGVLLSRERRAVLEGELTLHGGPETLRFPQTYEYYSSLSLQR